MKKRFRSFAVTLVIVAVFLVIVVADDVRSSGNDFFIQYADQCFANGSIDLTDNDGNPVSESEKAHFVNMYESKAYAEMKDYLLQNDYSFGIEPE